MASIKEFLARRYPGNQSAQSHFGELLYDYESSGLAPPNLTEEIASGDDGKLSAHIWEAMLYRHLLSLGVTFQKDGVRKSGQIGPDFGIEYQGRTIWIEAVTPSPEGIPKDWLEPPKRGKAVEVKIKTMPHKEMLLRWTTVLKDKRDKLQSYIEKNIIKATDCTIIAVNSSRLRNFAFDDLGISQLPFAVEAVFPIGPVGVPITPNGQIDGEPIRIPRYTIQKANGTDISTANFLDLRYANISAIMGCHRGDMFNGVIPLTIVHNPLAIAPLPRAILGADKEYVADENGDQYIVHPLTETS